MQPLIDQSVVMALSTDGRAKMAKSLGAPLALIYDQAFYHLSWNCVVKGSPLKDKAMQLVNYMNRADRQAVFSQMRFMATTNVKALESLPAEVQEDQMTAAKYKDRVFSIADLPNFWALADCRKPIKPFVRQVRRAAQFVQHGGHGFAVRFLIGAGKVNQVGVVSDDGTDARFRPGPAKLLRFFFSQRLALPLVVVLGEDLQRGAIDRAAPLDRQVKSARNGHVRA